jgi:hypothetical protein
MTRIKGAKKFEKWIKDCRIATYYLSPLFRLIFYTLKTTLLIINELSAPKFLLAQHFDFQQDTSLKIFKKTLQTVVENE